jgi:hypothetical protein
MKQWIGSFALLALLLAGLVAPARGEVEGGGCPGSMSYTEGYLTNGGFEEDYHPEENDLIGNGWTRVNWNGNPNWTSTRLSAIENGGHVERMECEDSQLIRAENFESVGAPYDTVLLQRVTGLTPGQVYSFSGWVLKIWGGTYQPGREEPRDPHAMGSWIGVDPKGGTDPRAATVIWSDVDWDDEVPAKWANHRMTAVPEGNVMTVFVRIQHNVAKSHTVAFVDAMEHYDAPRVTLQTQSGSTTESEVTLRWSGVIPQSLQERGQTGSVFHLFSDVQQQQGDGSWATIQTIETLPSGLGDISARVPVNVPDGQSARFRIAPYAYERLCEQGCDGRTWPPTWHVGPATEPVTITRGEPGPPLTEHVYLPLIARR